MGERARRIGEEAEDKIFAFLDSLGYEIQDTNNEEYDIDAIATSPEIKPALGLASPRYSPGGLVAFEIRESTINEQKVNDFRKKILRYNAANNGKLDGGIYIVDRRISSRMFDFMKRRKIWGWDVRRQRLYREKVNIFSRWFMNEKAFVTEIPLDSNVSCLRVSTPPPARFKHLLSFSFFFDDVSQKLSPRLAREAMNRIKETSIVPLISLGIRPMNVLFEFYSIGGLSKHLREEIYKTVVDPWKAEGITVLITANPFVDFRSFSAL